MSKKQKFDFVVCKPCWELHYCPYGTLVELFPLLGPDPRAAEMRALYESLLEEIGRGEYRSESEIWEALCRLAYLDPVKWEEIEVFDSSGLRCNVYGHVCPVFFAFDPGTETKEGRRFADAHVPRAVMLKVVRRDGQRCQLCNKNVRDDELHLDHVIPVSKGGSSLESNLRVLCRDCNLKKGDSTREFLSFPGV